MKVILMRDVAKLGRRFTVAEVPDGYALNKLIPAGIAQAATAENLKRIANRADKKSADKETELADFKKVIALIKDSPVIILAPANEKGHLFKSVKAIDVVQALATKGQVLPVESIKLPEPIKALGEYKLAVNMDAIEEIITIIIKNN